MRLSWNDNPSMRLEGVDMGKYVLAWLLGVPATVLVLVYLILHH